MMRTVVILAHAVDDGAASVADWVAHELGCEAVSLVRPESLSLARWSQRVHSDGGASTRIELPYGKLLNSGNVGAVLNRVWYLPVPRFHRSSAKNREYAAAEMQAVIASWLASLGRRVVHVVRRHAWVSPTLPRQHWASAAAMCGLPVAVRTITNSPCTQAAVALRSWRHRTIARDAAAPANVDCDGVALGQEFAGTVLIAGDEIGGPFAKCYGSRCQATARLLGFPLLEFDFATEAGEAVLVHVDPLPSLVEAWAVALVGRLLESLAGAK